MTPLRAHVPSRDGPGVAVDEVHAVTTSRESNTEIEAGGAGADDADVHPFKVPEHARAEHP